jgi:DUF971 family protein
MDLVGEEVAVAWSDGHESFYSPEALRAACPCAMCKVKREKGGGAAAAPNPFQLFEAVPKIKSIEEVGRYAIQFHWTDRHDSGIYDYRMLRGLCACGECAAAVQVEQGK